MDLTFSISYGRVHWGNMMAEPITDTAGKAEDVRVEASAESSLASRMSPGKSGNI